MTGEHIEIVWFWIVYDVYGADVNTQRSIICDLLFMHIFQPPSSVCR